ncbi:MAG: hypothetical protein Q9218_007446 [Villophora microphyllina]
MAAKTQHSMRNNEAEPYAKFELELEEDEEEAEQLSTSDYREIEEETGIARQYVTEAYYWTTFRIIVECQKPRLVTWQGQDLCLITFDLAFAVESPPGGKGRFKDAVLQATFVDEETSKSHPNGSFPLSAAAYTPEVLAFAPHVYYGPTTVESKERKHTMGPSVGDPTGIAKVTYNYETACKVDAQYRQTIHGYRSASREMTKMRWSLWENKSQKSGLYESFSVSSLVKHHHGRNFAIKFKGSCHTSLSILPFSRAAIGKKDDPVLIRTDRLEAEPTPFTDGDLFGSTFLEDYGGRFVRKHQE